MRIGFAGLGRMGRRMAANLHAAGFDLTVWNRSPERAQDFAAEHGAAVAGTPAELAAGADVVITMLADDAAARGVYLGEGGAIAAPGAELLVEMGTMSPELIAELAAVAADHGKTFVDAPVSGATAAAEAAQLLIMAGGEPGLAERLGPAFDAIGRKTIWLGRPGAGAAMKLSVNLLIHGLNQTLAEAMALAEASGIAPDVAFDVIENSAAAAPMLSYRKPLYLDEAAHPVSFTVELARKDVAVALALAEAAGLAMPQSRATGAILDAAMAQGFGQRDMAAILEFMREQRP